MTDTFLRLSIADELVDVLLDLDPEDVNDNWLLMAFKKGVNYEQELMWLMGRVLKPGDIAVDVGANIGYISLLMGHLVGAAGKVVAYEPGINNLPHLYKHLRMNNVKNVEVIEQPLWERKEMVPFYLNSDTSGSNSIYDPGQWKFNARTRDNPQKFELMATTLDAYPFEKTPKLIKIDTEGTEECILRGAHELLIEHKPPYIFVELNPFGMKQFAGDTDTFRSFMARYGYELFFVHENGCIPSLVPHNTKVRFVQDSMVKNALFSTLEAVGRAWPEALE